ncbi:MAG: hypothetical protein KDA21_04375 [Phycisphaerales bacterium]|nr:hypothetical protein [Phycisphaerales bacterium]
MFKPIASLTLGALLTLAAPGLSQVTSSFTYQGLLTRDDQPVQAATDFQFSLWTDEVGGVQVGATIDRTLTPDRGVFSASLDFGAGAFSGEERWLQVAVRAAGIGSFDILDGRQHVTPTPYALSAGSLHPDSSGRVSLADPNGQPLHLEIGYGSICVDADGACDSAGVGSIRVGSGGIHGSNSSNNHVLLAPSNGHVGIGTTSPVNPDGFSKVLNVHGNTSASVVFSAASGGGANDTWSIGMCSDGNICAFHNGDAAGIFSVPILQVRGGSDIAEPFNVNRDAQQPPVQAGMVVSIDPEHPGELRLATSAYDPCVAGVISGAGGVNAGLLLTQEGTLADGEHPVAMTGRVYAWCDADLNGAIKPGDMLTTSSTPGHAMKAVDRGRAFGATIGKAMTSLESGRGLVLVLVRPQ